jgi:hypothetical protein
MPAEFLQPLQDFLRIEGIIIRLQHILNGNKVPFLSLGREGEKEAQQQCGKQSREMAHVVLRGQRCEEPVAREKPSSKDAVI